MLYLVLFLISFINFLSVDVENDKNMADTKPSMAIVIISKSLSDSRYHLGAVLEFYPM